MILPAIEHRGWPGLCPYKHARLLAVHNYSIHQNMCPGNCSGIGRTWGNGGGVLSVLAERKRKERRRERQRDKGSSLVLPNEPKASLTRLRHSRVRDSEAASLC